jgi:hypothetical protein
MFVQDFDRSNWVEVSLSNGTCATLETGLTSGEYCTPLGWTSMPGLLVFGAYISFSVHDWTYVAAYSVSGTDVIIGQLQGWSADGSAQAQTAPGDLYIKTVGTTGLSLSSYDNGQPYLISASRISCPWSTSILSDDVVMASTVLPDPVNGRIMAVFHLTGNFTMLLPTSSTASIDAHCYINGVYQVMPGSGQLSLSVSQQTRGCKVFEFRSGMWDTAMNVVTFELWFPNAVMAAVTLNQSECGASASIPAGRYCDGAGSVVYTCNGDALTFLYPASAPYAYGTITANANGSMTYLGQRRTSRSCWSTARRTARCGRRTGSRRTWRI